MENNQSNRRRKVDPKPEGFQEMEKLVRDIFDGQSQSYHKWLHAMHQQVVLEFNLKNQASIANLAREE